MSNFYYRNPRLLVLTVALILVAGSVAFEQLPRLEDPELTGRDAIVTTIFPGADAERVESLVTEKIEQELFDVEEIKTIESTSRAGISIVDVRLQDEVVETDEIWSRIRDKLDAVESELPNGALEPEFEEIEVRGYAMIAALTWQRESEVSFAVLRRLAEGLEDRFRELRGTDNVELFGEPDEEITVELDHGQIASMGLTVDHVADQLTQSDSKVSAGLMRNPSAGDVLLEVEGEMDSIHRIRQTPIQYGDNQQFAILGDIAKIEKGIRRPSSDLALVAGRPAVTVAAFVDSDYRVDRWAADARQTLTEWEVDLPAGIGLEVVFDQSRYTEQRLDALLTNLALGAMAVVIVLLFMMGWRSALIVSLSLPLSAMMVLAGMKLLGIPLHQMSVTGLIIALGLLIDNAIVMVDEVHERLDKGDSVSHAIAESFRHLAVPLLGSTLTTTFAFAPIALMSGSVGEFVGTIAVSVILALFSSLFLALTVIPAVTGFVSRIGRSSARAWWNHGVSNRTFNRFSEWVLDRLLARPWVGIGMAAIVPVMGFIASSQLIEQFFPPTGRDMFQIEVEFPVYASMDQTEAATQQIRKQMLNDGRVRDVHWFLGNSAPSFYYNLVSDQEDAPFYAQGIVQLHSAEDSIPLIRQLQSTLDDSFPNARILVRQLEQGPPFDAPVELRIYGPNMDKLSTLGEEARTVLSAVEDVTHTTADLNETRPKLSFRLDEEKTRLAGLDYSRIARQLDASLEGAVGGSLVEATEELPIRVRLDGSDRGNLPQIASLELLSDVRGLDEHNQFIPIASLGSIELVPERAVITHRNGKRVNVVRGFVTAGVLPGKVLKSYRNEIEQWLLPDGYRLEWGGESAERNDAVEKLAGSVGVLMVLMVATLVLSFGSFRMAALIGFVAFLSGGLGLGSLWVFGYPFGFMAIIGTMGLVGIAINDSIVVLAAIRDDAEANRGSVLAVRNVVVRSSRHVFATTVTTIAGFLPLILEGGGFWPPLAVTIAGGVIGATLLALILVPSAFLLTARTATDVNRASQPASAVDRETPDITGSLATC
ncbi:MAG: efflux RND transporter permease subunit [Planctomycetota bacterium]